MCLSPDTDECRSNPCQNGGSCMDMLKRYQCTCQFDFSGYNCQRSKCIQWARLGPAWLGWAGLGWACQLSFRLAGFGVSCLEMGLIRFKFSLRSASTQLQLSQSWRGGSFCKITVLLHYSMFGKLDCCLSVVWVHIQIQLNFPRSIVTQFQKLRTKIKLCRSNILYVSYTNVYLFKCPVIIFSGCTRQMDIVFVLDLSGSIIEEYKLTVDFAKEV